MHVCSSSLHAWYMYCNKCMPVISATLGTGTRVCTAPSLSVRCSTSWAIPHITHNNTNFLCPFSSHITVSLSEHCTGHWQYISMPIFSIQLQPVHVNHSKSNNYLTRVNHSILTIIWLKVRVYTFNSTNSAVQWGQPGPSNLVKPVSPTALKWHSWHKERMEKVIYKQSLLMLL